MQCPLKVEPGGRALCNYLVHVAKQPIASEKQPRIRGIVPYALRSLEDAVSSLCKKPLKTLMS